MKKKIKIRNILPLLSKSIFSIVLMIVLEGSVIAQKENISIFLNDTTLEAVLNDIKNQSDVNIVFNNEEIRKAPKVSVEIKNATVEEAIKKSLLNTHLEYEILNNTIIIKPSVQKTNKGDSKKEEKNQTLRGRILDRDSKVSLPFANVLVLNSSPTIGVTSDVDGYFKIENLPVGRYSIQVSYVGYKNVIIPEIFVGSAKEVLLTVELIEATQEMEEVVFTVAKGQPLNEMATVSAKSFSVEETKRYPASISDPARMAQVFAGVSTTDDASNEIVIRGNSPNWMLWRLEGVEIPSPNHFAEEGFTAGAVSILSTNMLGKSDFYTGAFSAEYGNSLSGVFDIKFRNGNNEQREYSAQIGVLGAEVALEGPFKKGYRGSYLINYRYSTLSLLNDLNIEVSENALPNYQDLSFKFNLPTKKLGNFSIWGIGGKSDSDEKYYPDTTFNEIFDYGYKDMTTTAMYATGISHTFFPDLKSYFKTVISTSGSLSTNNYDDMDTLGTMHNIYNDDLNSSAIRLSTFYNRKVSNKLTLRAGLSYSKLSFDYFSEYTDDDYVFQDGIDGNGSTNIYQSYMLTKYKFTDEISFTGGLHYTHFALCSDNRFEPRASLQIELKNNQQIGIGFGMHSRTENLPVYFVAFEDPDGSTSYLNKSLGLTHSTHYVASYEKIIKKDWLIKTEVYYQDISNLAVPNNPDKPLAPSFNGISNEDTLVNSGKGKNYGIELTVQKFFTNNYYLLFSSSLFESKYKPFDGKWYNNRFNSNYIFNLVAGKEIKWGDNKMLSLNGKFLWTGGKRIFPIDLEKSIIEGEENYIMEDLYTQKAPDYFRIDLGIKLHFFKQKMEHILSLDIQNVTNRMNVWGQYYNKEDQEITDFYMAGLIPVLSYRIEF